MKFIFSKQQVFILFIACAVIILSGCATAEKYASPWTTGGGFTTMPGWSLGKGTLVHAVLGYYRFQFQGGGGHNDFLQLGGQVRHVLNKTTNGIWLGGEVAYVDITSEYKNAATYKPRSSAIAIGPVGGYRFQLGKVPLSVYIAPDFLHRSGFKFNGMTTSPAFNGFFGRVGVDFHFMSLLARKGR